MNRFGRLLSVFFLSSLLLVSSNKAKANPQLMKYGLEIGVNVISQLISALVINFFEEKGILGKSKPRASQQEYDALKKLLDTYSLQRDYIQALDKYSSGRALVWDSKSEVGNGFQDLIFAWKKSLHGYKRAKGLKRYPWDVLLIKIGITIKKAVKAKRPGQYKSTTAEIDTTLASIALWWGKYKIFHKLKKKTGTHFQFHYQNPFESGVLVLEKVIKRSYLLKKFAVWSIAKTLSNSTQAIRKEHKSKLSAYNSLGEELKKFRLSQKFRKKVLHLFKKNFQVGYQLKTWPSGQLRSFVKLHQTKRQGLYRSWSPNGHLTESGHYKSGNKDGVWKGFFFLNQKHNHKVLRYKGSFANGKKKGPWKWYYPTGRLRYSAYYRNGLWHGAEKSFHEEGKLLYLNHYQNGKMHGKYTKFDSQGNVIIARHYQKGSLLSESRKLSNGLLLKQEWYWHGAIKRRYSLSQSSKIIRSLKSWHPNSIIKNQHQFDHRGKKHGKQITWYSNGQIKSFAKYKNGKQYGVAKRWYKTGRVRVYSFYRNGSRHGLYMKFDKRSRPIVERTYSRGQLLSQHSYTYTGSGTDLVMEYYQGTKKVLSRKLSIPQRRKSPTSVPTNP